MMRMVGFGGVFGWFLVLKGGSIDWGTFSLCRIWDSNEISGWELTQTGGLSCGTL